MASIETAALAATTTRPPYTLDTASIPDEMKSLRRWVLWKYKARPKGKTTKPLYQTNGLNASHSNPKHWSSFELVLSVFNAGGYDGIGWVIAAPYVGIDFDEVRNPETGEIVPTALKHIHALNSYTEVSPSGDGLHVIVKARLTGKGRKKDHVEIYDVDRYLTVTGNVVAGTSTAVEGREQVVRTMYDQIEDIEVALKKETATESSTSTEDAEASGLVVTDPDKKFDDLMRGDWQEHYPGVSEAVSGLVCMLARRTDCDREAMDEQFQASGLHVDHWVEKWERLGESEIDRAISLVEKSKTKSASKTASKAFDLLPFAKPQVHGGTFDFVVAPPVGSADGYFPRGDVSDIGGASGTMKTSLMIDILNRQKRKMPVQGRKTFGLDFLIIMADRGVNANLRTLHRMKIDPASIPLRNLEVSTAYALPNIQRIIEAEEVMPAVVFIEGADMLVSEPNKTEVVAPFLKSLGKLAQFYHIAIVVSLGAPKARGKDVYITKRDQLYGSVAWGRMTETVMVLQYPSGAGDMTNRRELSVLPRNGPPERYWFEIRDGNLVEVAPPVDADKPPSLFQWVANQTTWFTAEFVVTATGWSEKTVRTKINTFVENGLLKRRPVVGSKNQWEYAPMDMETK